MLTVSIYAVIQQRAIIISQTLHLQSECQWIIKNRISYQLVSCILYFQPLTSMQIQKVRSAFEKKGYTPNAYIDKREYLRVLDSLVVGGEFHEEVADELWTQAAGDRPSRELRVNQICTTIVEAQNILRTRIQQTNEQIGRLQTQKRRLQANTSKQSIRRIQQIDTRLDELYGEKESFEEDYRLVTEPFGIQLVSSTFKSNQLNVSNHSGYAPAPAENYLHPAGFEAQPTQKTTQFQESDGLKYLFYLTLAFGFIQIIMIYGKSDFLNLIVLTCLLSIYLMNFFDKIYINLTLGLTVVSVILDLVWLIMYAGPKWNPSAVSNTTIYQIGYMRFIVFFTVALIPLKIAMAYFLFRHRNPESQDKYAVSLGLMKIVLSANKTNPISKGLSNTPFLSQ